RPSALGGQMRRERLMTCASVRAAMLVAVCLWATGRLTAHHSFAAEFDVTRPVTLTGTVSRVAWTNPHAHIYIDVADGGHRTPWDLELGSPNALKRRGWSIDTLKVGDTVTMRGYLAKDNSHLANAVSMQLSDGRTIFAGSSSGTEPK